MKILSIIPLTLLFITNSWAQNSTTPTYEYQIVTSIESLIPDGLGRSRLLVPNEKRDHQDFTIKRDNTNKRNRANRKSIRVSEFEETKLLNFYNLGGIRFQNIVANDALVTSKLNNLAQQGWELAFVTAGVESDAGETDGQDIFITRYVFKRMLP